MTQKAINFDLDFTNFFPVPARPAPVIARETRSSYTARSMNLVCYAKARPGGSLVSPDAPVLVLEDHEGSRRLLEKVVALYGLPVRAAADVREFAKALRTPPMPRLILLDVGLPHANGFQILTHLRLHPLTSAIPVVMVTAKSDNTDVIRGLSLGADGYLSKPIAVNALRSVLDTVLQRPSAGA
jgi:CheY-like chemotaxis protein